MLAYVFIIALTASSALGKPYANCFFNCFPSMQGSVIQPERPEDIRSPGPNPAHTGYYSRPSNGPILGPYYQPSANIEEFGTMPVYTNPGYNQHVEQQVPVQGGYEGMFTHSSSKSNFEANHGYIKFSQPPVTRTVVQEPIRVRPAKVVKPAQTICQNYYDPCEV